MLRALVSSLEQIDLNFQFDVLSLAISLLFTLIAFWMGAFAWAGIIRSLNPQIPYLLAIKYHLLAITAKYVPGFGWQQVSKAFQLSRGGVPVSQTWQPVALELALVILTGLAVAAQTLYLTESTIFGQIVAPGLKLGISIFLWAACAILPFVALRTVNREISMRAIRGKNVLHLWIAELFDIVGWITFGAALWFIVRGMAPIPLETLPYCVITLIVSFMVGFAVIVAPNGLGVRELTMSTLLQVILPIHLSITVALLSRVILVAAEFLAVCPFVLMHIWRSRDWSR